MIRQPRRDDRRDRPHRGAVVGSIVAAWLVVVGGPIAAARPSAPPVVPPPIRTPPVIPPPIGDATDRPTRPPASSTKAKATDATDAKTTAATEPPTDPGDAPSVPATAPGRQHLVKPGQELEKVLAEVGPGDEVILWPGTYGGASVRGLAGRPGAPIIIRGLTPEEPPVIEGGAWGLRLRGVSHLRLRDLVIARSRIDGIEIGPDDVGTPSHDVHLQRVRVEETGERPGRHGISLVRVANVTLREVTVTGWTGSAIEVVGSRDVTIDRASLRGTGRGELLGIRLRAGTTRTTVREVLIADPGLGAIALGGRSLDADFPADHVADRDGRRWEVQGPVIEDVTIVGSDIAMTFLGVSQASIMHVTIVDPRRSAFRVARPRDDAGFPALEAASISRCLMLWRKADDPTLAEFGPGADDAGLWLEENLWWRRTSPFPSDTDFPGQESFPQLVEVDPAVDEHLRPRTAAAADFGDRTPTRSAGTRTETAAVTGSAEGSGR